MSCRPRRERSTFQAEAMAQVKALGRNSKMLLGPPSRSRLLWQACEVEDGERVGWEGVDCSTQFLPWCEWQELTEGGPAG